MGLSGAVAVPAVDLGLEFVTLGEQCPVLGGEVVDDLVGTCQKVSASSPLPGMASLLTKS